jgi:hypothetical protein
MVDDRTLQQKAKNCWTKEAWDRFIRTHGEELAAVKDAKIVRQIFAHLQKDSHCLQYSPKLWETLLRACLTSSDFALGREIAQFSDSMPSVQVALASAEIFIASNQPEKARQIVVRALRFSNLEPWERQELQLTLCNTYVESGKYSIALKHLEKLRGLLEEHLQEDERTASLMYKIGRRYLFLGQYKQPAA